MNNKYPLSREMGAFTRKKSSNDATLAECALPEVIEGNSESDWALWEDSVSFQESLYPSDFMDSVQVKDEQSPAREVHTASDSPDPFSSVTRNRD